MKRISSGTVTVCVMAIVVGLVAAFVVKQVLAPKPQPVVEVPKEPTGSRRHRHQELERDR